MSPSALSGTTINALAIVIGGLSGAYIVKGVPESMQKTVIEAVSLAVIFIGLKTAWTEANIVVTIVALALGALCGELADIDGRLTRFASSLEQRFMAEQGGFARGFITATLVYIVGAMAIMGAVENGITGNCDTLLAKSALDGITAIVFASALGIGVAFSAVPVFLYQGVIALAASTIAPYLTEPVIASINSAGGMLILGIGLNLAGVAKIKIANLLPAMPIVAGITILLSALGGRL